MHNQCPLQTACWIICNVQQFYTRFRRPTEQFSSQAVVHLAVGPTHPIGQSPLCHMCYLELVHGFTYCTLHVSPSLQWGAYMLFPQVILPHCLVAAVAEVGKGLTSPPRWWTSGVVKLLSLPSSPPRDLPYRPVLLRWPSLLLKLIPKLNACLSYCSILFLPCLASSLVM